MTDTELTDRLREAIVLDGPDVWRSNGYLQDAQQAGLSLADALKRANEISQEVANNNLLFQNIQARIARLAQPSRSQYIEQDLNQIVNAATSLKLSPDFVRNQWVPTILHRIAPASKPQPPEPVVVPPTLPTVVEPIIATEETFEKLIESEPEPPKPTVITPEPVRPVDSEPVTERPVPVSPPAPVINRPAAPPSLPEPPPIVRSFTATPARIKKGQGVTLAWEVENLLAVTIDDLGEGLSPSNRGWVKPLKTTDYTLFDANDNPLSTVRVEVIKPDRSGVYGILFALALLAVIYWFIKSSNTPEPEREPKSKPEQTTKPSKKKRGVKTTSVSRQEPEPTSDAAPIEATDTPQEVASESIATLPDAKKKELPISKPVDETLEPEEPIKKPANPTDARQGKYVEAFGNKPYDKVELGIDEQGWRRARSHGRWGYVNEFDEWVIQPKFEAITPFKGNTAAVFLNGQLITINRSGEQARN